MAPADGAGLAVAAGVPAAAGVAPAGAGAPVDAGGLTPGTPGLAGGRTAPFGTPGFPLRLTPGMGGLPGGSVPFAQICSATRRSIFWPTTRMYRNKADACGPTVFTSPLALATSAIMLMTVVRFAPGGAGPGSFLPGTGGLGGTTVGFTPGAGTGGRTGGRTAPPIGGRTIPGIPGLVPAAAAALAAAAFCACCLFLFTTQAERTSTAPAAPRSCSLSTMSVVRWPKVCWSRTRVVPSHTNGRGLPAASFLSMIDFDRNSGVTG